MRLLADFFQQVSLMKEAGSDVECHIQMVEVYNEKVRDLLAPTSTDHLQIRQSNGSSPALSSPCVSTKLLRLFFKIRLQPPPQDMSVCQASRNTT